jgi:hypothetical protein
VVFTLKLHDGRNMKNKNMLLDLREWDSKRLEKPEFEEMDQLKIHAKTKTDLQKYFSK